MKRSLLILALLSLPIFIWLFWQYSKTPQTLSSTLNPFEKAGEETKKDLSRIPSLPVTEDENSFAMQDDNQTGLSIAYANQNEDNRLASEEDTEDPLTLSFPKDQTQPIEIKLDQERTITMQDLKNQGGFTFKKITNDTVEDSLPATRQGTRDVWYQKLFKTLNPRDRQDAPFTYLTATNQRKTLLYTFQKDHATNEKKLKSWTLYEKGNGIEEEAYRFTNAKIKINDDGNAEVFYFGEKDIQNQQTQADVEPSLLERAQRVISQDMGEDILNSNKNPDFLIPKPFFYDKNGDIHETDWKYDEETNTLSLQISTKDDLYPLALDPTLAFTAPAQSNTGWVVDGEVGLGASFGTSLVSGDFNADGKTDLAVGASGYSTNTGRVYIFYNDGSISTAAVSADVIITGETTNNYFGRSLTSGDFNADGRIDLTVGAYGYSANTGRAYLFYNDSSIPTTAATADVIITGETTNNYFGYSLASGDFNADGKIDLAVGAYGYSTNTGRVYLFYNDGSIPTAAASADAIITGETTSNQFGIFLTPGDFNADGKTDLTVGASGYSSNTGRVYLFYNGSIITENASGADVIITGETTSNYLGNSFTSGDFNADGTTDLAVGAWGYSSNTGRVYLFYSGSIITENASGADVIITGAASNNIFGISLTSGDFNADGITDLTVGASGYSSNTGRVYLFYNDGSIPTTAATADVIITGEVSSYLGNSFTSGDWNADGRVDLVVGASRYASDRGRAYIFTSQNGQMNTNISLTGETTSNYFGYSLTSGDFNADGRIDLTVGAYGYSTNTGRIYLFYNDGSIPTTAATADVIITGETTGNSFGFSLTSGDFNADGKIDLAGGAYGYSSSAGRAYIFYNGSIITENASGADIIITGEASSSFSRSLASGDFNADGTVDLAAGASEYSSAVGRAYIFYNNGSYPATAATADVLITASGIDYSFGYSLVSGDFNFDGRMDLAVGAYDFNASFGFVHIFYNDGSIPTTAATADIIITGEVTGDYFGISLASGDWNADGKTDLAVGAYLNNCTYLFYNDGSIPTTAATADVIITGESNSYFGTSLASGDLNADGKTDLVVGARNYSSATGRVYLFYNDGSIPTTAATADVIITGETTSNQFGIFLTSGDFNADGKIDLAVGAYGYSTNTGRVYLYETRDNFAWQLQVQSSLSGGLRTNPSFSGQELKVTGEIGTGQFGDTLASGDFNADGKTDLAVGAYVYSTNTGRAYIFYGDSHIPFSAVTADVIITGETTTNYFGSFLSSGDFNADGKTDLAVGAYQAATNGRAYIFYNDDTIPTTAATADVIITGENTNNLFGASLASGDFNADGKTDLVVGAYGYSTNTGRAYIFYNGSIITENASGADVIITGETTSNNFGISFSSGDLNADGKTDLAVGASGYSTNTGRAYLFYNGSIITENASGADVIITGESTSNYFGIFLASGDFNTDGKTDLAVGAYGYSSNTGRAYLFYNGSIITENASGADVIITGESNSYFGYSLTSGDFNTDGKTDLAVGALRYSSYTGRVYLFYNDGSIPTTADTADIIITGEATSNNFSRSIISGDWNADGKTDLAVGADGYSSSRGRIYMYTFNDGVITGAADYDDFGSSLTSGDWNNDGEIDLAVGASAYSTNTGRAYIFYNDSSIPTTAANADVIITGEATTNYFGWSLTSGDFNADGKTDLVVGAMEYSSGTGRTYLFYNGSIVTENASGADTIITGGAGTIYFGRAFASGDFNADGKTDLAVGTYGPGVCIFYNDGSYPAASSSADIIITGEGYYFGYALTSGDFNADSKTDLAVGAEGYSSSTGRAYIFYNDGSIPTTAATADVIITGETTSNYFGSSLTSGDFNSDGKTDLTVGASGYSSDTGRSYLFYSGSFITENASGADVIITGEATGDSFGYTLTSGDFNADGKTDFVVGSQAYSSATGRTYLFYADGTLPTTAATADIIITGQATGNRLGWSLAAVDWNTDGKTDLIIGAKRYATYAGRIYIFITEAKLEETVQQLKSKGAFKAKGNFQVK